MGDNNNNIFNTTFLMLLQSLARLFLRFGRGFREYSDLSKAAFVIVASEDYGVHGRPTNVSRIAAMTGLTRKEISRIRTRIESGEAATTERGTPLQEVVAAWRSIEEFLDDNGEPAAMPLAGGRGSFQSLIKRSAGDIPEGAMRKELERTGAAELVNGTVVFCPPRPENLRAEEEVARRLRAGPYPLMAAIAHNEVVEKSSEVWPLETVGLKAIRKSDVARVRKLVSIRLRAATTTIADLLDAYATIHSDEKTDEPTLAISAGVYYSEGAAPNDD